MCECLKWFQKKKSLTPAFDWKKKKRKEKKYNNLNSYSLMIHGSRNQAEIVVRLKNWEADRGGSFYNGTGFLICEGFEF